MTEVKSYWGVAVPTRGDLRRFGIVLAALLALLGGYLWYVEAVGIAQLVHAASLVLLGTGLALPMALKPIYFPYMWLARIVAFVNIHSALGTGFLHAFYADRAWYAPFGARSARPQNRSRRGKLLAASGPFSVPPRPLSQALLKPH